MPKYEVVVRPLGLLNQTEWPDVGESVELAAELGDAMVEAGTLKKPKAADTKKAAAKKAPPKAAEKAAEKKVEKRPASKADEEKR